MSDEITQRTLRVKTSVYQEFAELCKIDGISVNTQLNQMIRTWISNRKRKGKTEQSEGEVGE